MCTDGLGLAEEVVVIEAVRVTDAVVVKDTEAENEGDTDGLVVTDAVRDGVEDHDGDILGDGFVTIDKVKSRAATYNAPPLPITVVVLTGPPAL